MHDCARASETILVNQQNYKNLSFTLTAAILNPVEGERQKLLFPKGISGFKSLEP